jgi:O-antigen/teichoic acid export membrane protein
VERGYVARGTLWLLAASAFQQAAGFAGAWLALRFVDLATYGALVFVLSALALPIALVCQGLPQAATHFLAARRAGGEPAAAREVLAQIRWLVLLGGVAVALAAPAAARLFPASIAGAFESRVLGALLGAAIVLGALLETVAQAALGLRSPRQSAAIGSFAPQALRLLAILVVLPFLPTAAGILASHVLALAGALVLAELWMARAGLPAGAPRLERTREVYRFGLPLVGAEMLAVLLFHGDKILLGYLGDPAQVGAYGVASRLALLSIVPHWATGRVHAPVFAELWSAGQDEALRRVYQRNVESSLLVTGFAGALIVVNAGWLLRLFGAELADPELVTVVRILVAGLLFTVLAGNQGQLYRMIGRTAVPTLTTALAVGVSVALCLWLVPRYGPSGAALATAAAFVAMNAVGVLLLGRYLAFAVHPFGERFPACAAGAAAMLAVAVASGEHALAGSLAVAAIGAGGLALALPAEGGAILRWLRRAV